jgi:hypothetical protein
MSLFICCKCGKITPQLAHTMALLGFCDDCPHRALRSDFDVVAPHAVFDDDLTRPITHALSPEIKNRLPWSSQF